MSSITTNHVKIFDTTLRDGEQAPGFSMSTDAKLIVARALEALKVDIIEAGFAAASPGDAAAVRAIASEIEGATICSLARANIADIEAAARALEPARRKRIHTFIGTSPLHRGAKLKMSEAEIIERIGEVVSFARSCVEDVEFSPEDAIRTEREFLLDAMTAAIEAGATTINIPDTVGYTTPEEIADLFRFLRANAPPSVTLSTHCHDDLGMAVANSLAAVAGGARQIECAINGIGERAGNCSLEEAVMALAVRRDFFGISTDVDTRRIYAASQALSRVTHSPIPRNKAIVGRNAFAHEAGIHQHGVLADRRTYEIMDAESVGVPQNMLVLGKHSGKHAVAARIKALGFDVSPQKVEDIFPDFKHLADTCREVTDADLVRLVTGNAKVDGRIGPWRMRKTELRVDLEEDEKPFARITMEHDNGDRRTVTHEGEGPIDAAFAAVCAITGIPGAISVLDLHHVASEGVVRAEAVIDVDGEFFSGKAQEVDIADAAVAAFVAAINQAAALKASGGSRMKVAAGA
ncbi:MAG: 2-isopropylmalate synthase [Pseudomonadota bacterium]